MPRRCKTSSSCINKSIKRLQHLSLDENKKEKKLHLVLDLDHTLYKKEKYLLK
ncbi:unnamed protein product, partial [Arabidopsis halleri]